MLYDINYDKVRDIIKLSKQYSDMFSAYFLTYNKCHFNNSVPTFPYIFFLILLMYLLCSNFLFIHSLSFLCTNNHINSLTLYFFIFFSKVIHNMLYYL